MTKHTETSMVHYTWLARITLKTNSCTNLAPNAQVAQLLSCDHYYQTRLVCWTGLMSQPSDRTQ